MKIVIIGNGVAGITAARYIRVHSDHKITVISAESDHFYSRCALMYIYMGHMRYQDTKPYEDFFWEKNRIELVRDYVEQINRDEKYISTASGEKIYFDKLLLSTGSKWKHLLVKGMDLNGVQGLYSLQDLELMAQNTRNVKKAVVVGGGLIGIEMCEMLRSKDIEVTFLVREHSFYDLVLSKVESEILHKHIREHGVDLRLNTEVRSLESDGNGNIAAVITDKGENIPCQFAGVTIGVKPNINLARNAGIATSEGILVDRHMQTNIPDIYAAGDCAEFKDPPSGRKAVEPFWYVAKMHGKAAAFNILGKNMPYDAGVYFNSAKFFDIEYQVYGSVPYDLPTPLTDIIWTHPQRKKSIRIVYDGENMIIKGFSLLGVRYRHDICNQMIAEEWQIDQVMQNLAAANFDPEFEKKYEKEIIALYSKKHKTELTPAPKSKIRKMIFGRK